MDSEQSDVAIVGAGPAGLIAGLSLAATGFKATLLGPAADPNDGRTSALFQGSIALLKKIGAWPAIEAAAEPLDAIRLIDATAALFRAPEVTFQAAEIGEVAFGYNVPNAVLTAALESLAADRLNRVVTAAVTAVAISDTGVTLRTQEGGTYSAPLVAAADGRLSACRTAAGIEPKRWSYDQAAIVCTFTHTRNHKRISTEFHRRCGPLTVVPAPGGFASNLVWVDTLNEAQRLSALTDSDFVREFESHLCGLLGRVTLRTPRRMFPLSGQTADPLAKNRIALIGEAGHVIPPIGAQGLNLSFRDAATLADVAAAARGRGEDIGGPAAMAAYAATRRSDVTSRIWTVDLLNRSLLSSYTPIHALRGLGLFALNTVPLLRRRIMREGIAPQHATPSLMQRAI
ncbi:MAG: UbiH/UbiF family hydroxylase [Hyphomicrobium sp.]